MFSKFRSCLALVVVSASALACMASAASANTVVLTGGGAISGNAGATQFALPTQARTISCTSSTLTATSQAAGTYTTPLPFTFANLYLAFSGCTITGGVRVAIDCTSRVALWEATRVTSGGRTDNQITANACTVTLNDRCVIDITGSVSGSYDNAANRLTVLGTTATQSLAARRHAGSICSTLTDEPRVTYSGTPGPNVVYAIAPVTTMTVT